MNTNHRVSRCLLMLAGHLALPAASFASPDLRADVQQKLTQQGLVGAVWALVTADGNVQVGAAGLKDARTRERLAATDRVHVGSVTKTLVATGILRLVSEGRLALDTPVSDVVPALTFDNPWASTNPVRVRHLLDHTAGLDDARLWQVFSLKPTADTPLATAFSRDQSLLRVRARPGSRFSYSNMGYTVLGMVIESVVRERYEHYLDAHLLRPLGMHDSTFTFVSQIGAHADPRLAMGHFEDEEPHAAVPAYLRPAMQFTTTAADMARFARFIMSDGRIEGQPFIDAPLLRAMGQPTDTEAAIAGLSFGYALGLASRDRHGRIGRCHGGSTVGYRAMFCVFPAQQEAFFVAMNADSEDADYGRFDALLLDALNVASPAAPAAAAPPRDIALWNGLYVPAPNQFASLALIDTALGFARGRWDGTVLHLTSLQRSTVLSPAGGRLFTAADRATISHALLISRDGKPVISDGTRHYEKVPLRALAPLWISLIAGAGGLAYLLVSGIARVLVRRMSLSEPLFVPFAAALGLFLPLPLFWRQPFLALGDMTPASLSLALATALLPFAMLVGVGLHVRRRPAGMVALIEIAAMIGVLQCAAVLAAWGLLPLRLWA